MTRKITKIISFMKSFYPFIFILLFTVPVYGQDMPIGRKVAVEAFVLDSFTLAPIGQIQVTIRDRNQKIIKSTQTVSGPIPVSFGQMNVGDDYTIEIQSPSYKTIKKEVRPMPERNEKSIKLPDILMKLKPASRDSTATTMHEVTITASKLKFVWKRDTLIYDATAFDLHEGAMLKDLIRQLPGTQMDEYGQITVFGRRVDCLTLNGKEFFKGDNRVMLDNLPYFMIKDIKVYERGPELYEQWKTMPGDKKDYVMDVILKRDYRRGYLANAEAGGGTGGHWLGRAFGSIYSDRTRIGLVFNANDLNDNREPGRTSGDWQSIGQPKGVMTTVRTKSDMNFYGKKNKWHDMGRVELEWDKPETAFRRENFTAIQNNQIHSLSSGSGMSKMLSLKLNNTFSSANPNLDLTTDISLERTRTHDNDSLSNFNNGSLVNRIMDAYYDSGRGEDYRQSLFTGKRMAGNHFLSVRAMGRYSNQRKDRYHLYDMVLADQDGEKSYRLHQNRQRTEEVQGNIGYNIPFPQANLSLYVAATWNYLNEDKDSPLWRLERDSAFFNSFNELGQCPVLNDVLADLGNSQYTHGHRHQMTYNAKLTYSDKGDDYTTEFSLNIPITTMWQKEHIQRGIIDVDTARHAMDFLPSLIAEIRRQHSQKIFKFGYTPSITRPSLVEMTGYEDSTDPLYIRRGNPQLKNAFTHQIDAYLFYRPGWQRYSVDSRYSITHNQMMPSLTYNPGTGGYVSKQTNVNGNWTWDNHLEATHVFGQGRRWQLTNSLGMLWQRITYLGTTTGHYESLLVCTRRSRIDYKVQLMYRKNEKFDITPHFNFVLNHATGNQASSLNANARDYIYGLDMSWRLPYGWLMATDVNMFMRRGYGAGMNTEDIVWNAQLTKNWMKGKLQTRLTAYDILNQVHLNTYTITANGYQAQWQKGLSRYALLSVFYRIDIKPKKSIN